MPEETYVSLTDLAKELELKRTSLYYYLNELKIQPLKFPLNKHRYITEADAERIRSAKKSPWKLQGKEDAA